MTLAKAIYRRVPILMREGGQPTNPWGIRFLRMLDMANDSALFRTAKDLSGDDWELDGNVFRKGDASYLPLYEAKMTNLFDHRHGSIVGSEDVADLSGIPAQATTLVQHQDANHQAVPRYWVPATAVEERLKRSSWPHGFFISFRDVARSTDIRTAIHAVLPRVGVGHKAPLILPFGAGPGDQALLLANLNSFVFDYFVRQKTGGASLSLFIVKQVPVITPDHYRQPCPWSREELLSEWLRPRVIELVYTARDLKPFAEDCGYDGEPFRWDEERRFQLRCDLDAVYFRLYFGTGEWRQAPGEPADDFARLKEAFPMPRHAVEYVMDTFPVVRKADVERYGHYRTKQRILEVYDQLARDATAAPPLSTPQVNILKAMRYVIAFLRKANRRLRRDILEAGLVLMINDNLREAFLSGDPVAIRNQGRRRSSLLRWLPVALEQLARTNRIEQDLQEEMPCIRLGPAAGDATDDREYHERAARAIEIIGRLGEQAARQAVEESVDEAANFIPV